MIFGYDSKVVNEFGLKQMREVSLQIPAADLRELAKFLSKSADELELAESPSWHRHLPEALRQKLGCDVIVLNADAAVDA